MLFSVPAEMLSRRTEVPAKEESRSTRPENNSGAVVIGKTTSHRCAFASRCRRSREPVRASAPGLRHRWSSRATATGLRLSAAVAIAAVLLAPGPALAQVVVSDGGSPSYSRAIDVPPGVAGMSPKLGLYYAGAGVNGPVGQGWSVQGLSSIVRCPATIATDGAKAGVRYLADDKLCLDGQRLIQIDSGGGALTGAGTNDAAGLAAGAYREFRTEKDSYARIRA